MNDNFVDISKYIPNLILDVRYNGDYNFVGTKIDGYNAPKVYLTLEACNSLFKVNEEINKLGYQLKIYDGYRPQSAVEHFIRWAKDIDDIKMKDIFYPDIDKKDLFIKGYIAEKSSHSRGSTVDLTIFDTKNNMDLDMGGYFDYFGQSSSSDYTNLNTVQLSNRKLLKDTMEKYGFKHLNEEWWHYTLINEPYKDTYFDFDIE